MPQFRWFAALLLTGASLVAGPVVKITATHDLAIARPAETISIPWAEVARALPGALLQKIVVRDADGKSLPYQVTNVAPQAKDPSGAGIAYGELLFQHDFASGEKTATFTLERSDDVSPVFPAKTYARYIPERLDDFAWENDVIAHRTYGPALAAPDETNSGKEVLVTSGLDVWCKRVDYLIVDRWYNKGHDHYHKDEGEGMDMYQVGRSRGCGGTGIWDGKTLFVGRNYRSWKILANGPVRTQFELTYDAWTAAGLKVSEVKRFTVDAGHQLDLIESTFHLAEGSVPELTVAIGLNKTPGDKGQDAKVAHSATAAQSSLTQWIEQKTNGSLGTAIVVDPTAFAGFAEDAFNQLILAKTAPDKPLRYLVGAGWSKAGRFTSKQSWDEYVAACVERFRSPVNISLHASP